MKRCGAMHMFVEEDNYSTPNVCVQRDRGHIDLSLEAVEEQFRYADGASIDLTPAEARRVARWLLKAAVRAERYTSDEERRDEN